MKKKYIIPSGIFIILLLFYLLCTFVVNHGEMAVVKRFGKLVRNISDPGLYLRLPYPINNVEKISARLNLLLPVPSEYLTEDKKNLIIETAICYKIADPVIFIKTVRNKTGLEVRLTDLLTSHTGLLLGHIELSELVNTDPEKVKFDKMNNDLTDLIKDDSKDLGIDVRRVFIKRIMLPNENRFAVFERMRAERNRIAKKYIAEGEEKAQQIRGEADRSSRVLLSEAKKEATIIKSKAEADAMKIYGNSYRENREFYNYIRSLEAYEKMFNDKTVIVLDENSPVLDTFFSGAKNAGK